MAFYAGEPSPGRTRPVSQRWMPGVPYYVSSSGPSGYPASGPVSYRPSGSAAVPSRPGDAVARVLGSGRPVPAMDTFRRPNTAGPNPYGITPGTLSQQNQGRFLPEFEGQEYLGGYPDDYASPARVQIPYGSDNLSLRYHAYQKRPTTKQVWGRPIYREGQQVRIASTMSVDQIRQWQAFFSAQGFKMGPAGFWTEFEADAMRRFMTMANGTPGGGMDVNVLRARVTAEVNSGRPGALRPGELAGMLGTPATGQNEFAPGGPGGPGGVGDELAPYTETSVERQVTQYSTDQGMALLRAELAREIGRRPTETEVSQYLKGLNSAARADPTVITSVVRVDPAAGTTQTTTTTDETGIDPQARATAFAQKPSAERSGYQTNRYIDALMNELGL